MSVGVRSRIFTRDEPVYLTVPVHAAKHTLFPRIEKNSGLSPIYKKNSGLSPIYTLFT